MLAALVTNHANHAGAIVARQEVTEPFCVTVRAHRTRPPWSIRMDESTGRRILHWSGCRGTGSYARRKVCDRTNKISLTPKSRLVGSFTPSVTTNALAVTDESSDSS